MYSALLSLLVAGANGAKESGSLSVTRPPELKAQFPDGIEMRPAMFGIPAYSGQSITGIVLYAPSNDQNGCAPVNKNDLDWPYGGAVILMLDRGNCTFVTKVRHAQEIGAHAAIIVDNNPETGIPYMADDGTGTDIQIPSMLIHMLDGEKIRKYVMEEETKDVGVVMSMSWDYANKDNRVEWELWSTSDTTSSLEFKKFFRPAVKSLGASALFTPHLLFQWNYFNCPTPGAKSDDDLPPHCANMCIKQGTYCGAGPSKDVPGYLAVQAFVRSHCVWQLTVDATPEAWFDYEVQVASVCPALGTECSSDVMDQLGIDSGEVDVCIQKSGGIGRWDGDKNELLDAERDLQNEKAIRFDPTILINEFRYTGVFSCRPRDPMIPDTIDRTTCGVLNSICLGFLHESEIDACTSSPNCPVGEKVDQAGVCGGNCQWDACARCLELSDPTFNKSCVGCDGVPDSYKYLDSCGICDGPGVDKCGRCTSGADYVPHDSDFDCDSLSHYNMTNMTAGQVSEVTTTGLPVWAVVLIVLGSLLVACLLAFIYMRHQRAKLRDDIDNLLQQYKPMADSGMVETGGRIPQDPHGTSNPVSM